MKNSGTRISGVIGLRGVPPVAVPGRRVAGLEKNGGNVILRWDSAEGGNYVAESSPDLADWTTKPPVPADGAAFETQATVPAADPSRSFHRVRLDGVDAYDIIDTP